MNCNNAPLPQNVGKKEGENCQSLLQQIWYFCWNSTSSAAGLNLRDKKDKGNILGNLTLLVKCLPFLTPQSASTEKFTCAKTGKKVYQQNLPCPGEHLKWNREQKQFLKASLF